MGQFFRQHSQVLVMILLWAATTYFASPLLYLVLPASVLLLRSRDLWPDMLFGFIIILVWSDMTPDNFPFRVVKTAKFAYIIVLALIFFMETARMQPLSSIFKVFLPFFVLSFIPIVASGEPIISIQKTISYALLYIVVPNYVLYSFRRQGWVFFRHLVIFILVLLLSQLAMPYYTHHVWVFVSGRIRGYFGNPNGLAIFCYLNLMLFTALIKINKDLFSFMEKVFAYSVLVYFLISCGSRTSLTASFMFVLFYQFFSISPFIGFILFLAFGFGVELISANLAAVLTSVGLKHYFRVETIEAGSGRYFAWSFAWQKINEGGYFLLGGGFGNDEYIMRQNYPYLRSMGHHGGVHNSYLTMWFNTGIVGVLVFFRSYFLIFLKANKRAPFAFAIMFSSMFSVMYESWLTGSLNPFTIMLLIIITVITEDEIVLWREKEEERRLEMEENGSGAGDEAVEQVVPQLILPAR